MAAKVAGGRYPCGFCSTRHHDLCPGTISNGSKAPNPTWTCPCAEQEHALGGQPPLVAEVVRLPASARPVPRRVEQAPVLAGEDPAPVATRRRGKATPFPEGVCSPYQFRAALLGRGLVPASFRPQTVYTWVTKAGKGGTFPVRWYGPDGQPAASGDAQGARPGVPVDEAVAWFTAQQDGKAA